RSPTLSAPAPTLGSITESVQSPKRFQNFPERFRSCVTGAQSVASAAGIVRSRTRRCTMPSPLEVRDWHELDVVSSDGAPVGKLIDVYVNNDTGDAEFLLVASGFLHNRLHLAPADGATRSDDTVTLGVTKEAVDHAPHIAADDDLTSEEERQLYAHYGIEHTPHSGGLLIVSR